MLLTISKELIFYLFFVELGAEKGVVLNIPIFKLERILEFKHFPFS